MTKHSSKTGKPDALLRNLGSALEQRLGVIEYRPLAALQAYAGHARKHPEKQIVQLVASMREFGFALPVLVDTEGVLVTGHARIEAARRLGLEQVPVLVADRWSKAQVQAYRLRHLQQRAKEPGEPMPIPGLRRSRPVAREDLDRVRMGQSCGQCWSGCYVGNLRLRWLPWDR